MGNMPMASGWTMSMVWMRTPEATWPGTAVSFMGMWVIMTAAMMLPSLIPTLWRYRAAVRTTSEAPLGQLTTLVATAYLAVWGLFGMVAFSVGAVLGSVAIRHPALGRTVPLAIGVVIVLAGAVQLTRWKARHLAFCRQVPVDGRTPSATAGTAWRYGLCLGLHCAQSCAPLMAIVLVVGIMDLGAMAVVTAAISLERLAPSSMRIAQAVGSLAVVAGFILIARAAGLG